MRCWGCGLGQSRRYPNLSTSYDFLAQWIWAIVRHVIAPATPDKNSDRRSTAIKNKPRQVHVAGSQQVDASTCGFL